MPDGIPRAPRSRSLDLGDAATQAHTIAQLIEDVADSLNEAHDNRDLPAGEPTNKLMIARGALNQIIEDLRSGYYRPRLVEPVP